MPDFQRFKKMNNSFSLRLSSRILRASNILRADDFFAFTPYEQAALTFCRDWISGKENFTLHTSGSTGIPKAITLHRRQMETSAALTAQALRLRTGDTALVCLNVAYIAGIMMLVRGMETGLHLYLTEPNATPLTDFQAVSIFDFLAFVPLQLQTMLEDNPENAVRLNRARAIIVGGAAVSRKLEDEIQALKSPVFHTYGMTETVSHIALRRLNGETKRDFFTTLEGVKIRTDERGCLVIQSPTAESEVITNDMVELISETQFRFLGRADNFINSGGVKVQAEKVEATLEKIWNRQNLTHRFFIAATPDEKLGETVTLFVEGELNLTLAEIRTVLLAEGLTRFALPRKIYFAEKFAETPTGKMDRKQTMSFLL
jgi:o-succinylbenzoate---CoA ligase